MSSSHMQVLDPQSSRVMVVFFTSKETIKTACMNRARESRNRLEAIKP